MTAAFGFSPSATISVAVGSVRVLVHSGSSATDCAHTSSKSSALIKVYQISVPWLVEAPLQPAPGPKPLPVRRPSGSSCQVIAKPISLADAIQIWRLGADYIPKHLERTAKGTKPPPFTGVDLDLRWMLEQAWADAGESHASLRDASPWSL